MARVGRDGEEMGMGGGMGQVVRRREEKRDRMGRERVTDRQ